jgi:hypothetical protein
MYAVEDETFREARSVLSAVAKELAEQSVSGLRRPVDLHELVRRSAPVEIPEGGESEYLSSIAASFERTFPVEELFPRKRRARDQEPPVAR